jgi:hypothetical protein
MDLARSFVGLFMVTFRGWLGDDGQAGQFASAPTLCYSCRIISAHARSEYARAGE